MSTIATTISLVQYSGTIFDQGTEGSCKANQICGALALMSNEYGVHIPDLARQQLYNDTRTFMGSFNTDSGSIAASAEKAATTIGIANESSFAYGPENLYVKPDASVYSQAATQKVSSFSHAPVEGGVSYVSNYIGNMLMQGKPVLVDAYVHYGFGVDPNSFLNPINGGHAYLVVGVDYASSTYTVQNSWGTQWANGGYGTIKFSDLPGIGPTSGPVGAPYQDLLGLSTINGFEGHDVQWTSSRHSVAELYVGILGRCSENSGMMFYDHALSNGVNLSQEADFLIGSAEGQTLYGSMTNSQFASSIYSSVIGRAIDSGGQSFWTAALDGGMSRGAVAEMIINTVDGGNDTVSSHDRLANLATVAMNYALTYQIDGTHQDAAHAALVGVTSDANTVQAALVGVHTSVFG